MVQIAQLLEERNMSFSFCVNKYDLLALCGLTLLYQAANLKHDSKLNKEIQRLVSATIKSLNAAKAPGYIELARVASSLITLEEGLCLPPVTSPQQKSMAAPAQRGRSSSKGSKKKAEGHVQQHDKSRRMTVPNIGNHEPGFSLHQRQSFDGVTSTDSPATQHSTTISALQHGQAAAQRAASGSRSIPNLDYLSLGNTPSQTQPPSPTGTSRMQTPNSMRSPTGQLMASNNSGAKMTGVTTYEWETLLGSMDGGLNNVYDAIYGGPSLIGEPQATGSVNGNGWSPDSWDLSGFNIEEFGRHVPGAQSVLSISDESLSSGEELATSELGLSNGSAEFARPMQGAEGFDFDANVLRI